MTEKKQQVFKSPDISKLKEVIIDHKTRIYIPVNADEEKARERYLSRVSAAKVK